MGKMIRPSYYIGLRIWSTTFGAINGSQGGRLVLIKSSMEAIHVHWHLMPQIPKDILDKTRKVFFNYLSKGSGEYKGSYLTRCKVISTPNDWCGWGIKNTFYSIKLLFISLYIIFWIGTNYGE